VNLSSLNEGYAVGIRRTVISTEDLLHSKGPGGPSDYIGYTSVTGRNDPALAPFEGLTKAPGVFTRLGSLGMGCNHSTNCQISRAAGGNDD